MTSSEPRTVRLDSQLRLILPELTPGSRYRVAGSAVRMVIVPDPESGILVSAQHRLRIPTSSGSAGEWLEVELHPSGGIILWRGAPSFARL